MGQYWKNCATIGVGKLEYVLVLPVRLCNIFITFFIHKDPNVSAHDTKGQGDSILKMVEILLYFLQQIGSVDKKDFDFSHLRQYDFKKLALFRI